MLFEEVIADSTVLSALLVITVLFTSAQSGLLPQILRIQTSQDAVKNYLFIILRTVGLIVFSILILWQLWPTVHGTFEVHHTLLWRNVYYFFEDLWVGQILLLGWQVNICLASALNWKNDN